jgi:hypothetical protein
MPHAPRLIRVLIRSSAASRKPGEREAKWFSRRSFSIRLVALRARSCMLSWTTLRNCRSFRAVMSTRGIFAPRGNINLGRALRTCSLRLAGVRPAWGILYLKTKLLYIAVFASLACRFCSFKASTKSSTGLRVGCGGGDGHSETRTCLIGGVGIVTMAGGRSFLGLPTGLFGGGGGSALRSFLGRPGPRFTTVQAVCGVSISASLHWSC